MAPRDQPTGVLFEDDSLQPSEESSDKNCGCTSPSSIMDQEHRIELVWQAIIFYTVTHVTAIYGAYLSIVEAKFQTNVWATILYILTGYGITAGAHRLWTHRAYKAKWQLKLMLITFHTIAFQKTVLEWVREHRVHHKYSETNADPHNSTRGLFFSHIGWLICRKHPAVIEKGREIDFSDVQNDAFVAFQHKYFPFLVPVFCLLLPTLVPVHFWGESWRCSFFVAVSLRNALIMNMTMSVNSIAHAWGNKPYDRYIRAKENLGMAIASLGEGWHNYHHVFPWDYKTSELGNYSTNMTTAFIDFCAKLGWAYDLKTVSTDMVRRRVLRTGDGSHPVWGWGDKDLLSSDVQGTIILNGKRK